MSERRIARMLHDDVPTLFEAPFSESHDSDVVLLGVPYEGILVGDRHTLYPPGSHPPETFYARFGADESPDAIRKASVIYSLEHEGGIAAELDFANLSGRLTIADAGNLDLDQAEATAEKTAQAGGITVALGGDHLVPLPLIRGRQKGRQERVGVLVFDSHLDLHPAPPLWAGSQWRTLITEGYLHPEDLVIVGPRGVRQSTHEIEFAREQGVTVIPLQTIDDQGLGPVADQIQKLFTACDSVYISLDIDVVDPAFCPAQKYPDAAGLAPREILTLMRRTTTDQPIAGFDLCCFSPRYDENQRGALLAARFALEAVYARARWTTRN
jgi:arginase family enzyme